MNKVWIVSILGLIVIISLLGYFAYDFMKPSCSTHYMIRDSQTGQCKIYVGCSLPSNLNEDPTCKVELMPEIKTTLNNPTRLFLNQTLIIEVEELKVRISGFSNSPCPQGSQCIWSGVGIFYEIQKSENFSRATSDYGATINIYGYQIKTYETDYKSYAEVEIVKEEELS